MRKVFNTDEGHGMGFWSNPKYRRLSAEDSSAGLKIPPEAKKYARRALITAGGLKVIGEAHIPGLGVTAKEPMYRAIHAHLPGGPKR